MATPLTPGEALARFSPLKSCGVAPLRLPKRHVSSGWRHDERNCLVEEGKATIVTRSASTSSVPLATLPCRPFQAEHLTRDRVTGWRPKVRHQQSSSSAYPAYTADQIAGFQLYEMKSQRLSSHEYGNNVQHVTAPRSTISLRVESSPTRIVELEAGTPPVSPPALSPAAFHLAPVITSSRPDRPPLQFPSQVPNMPIPRKPVGSGSVTTTTKSIRSTSDPLLIWPLEKSTSPERSCSLSPQKQKHRFKHSSGLEASDVSSPWDTHPPASPSPSLRARGAREGPNTKRPRPPVRFQSGLTPEQTAERMKARAYDGRNKHETRKLWYRSTEIYTEK